MCSVPSHSALPSQNFLNSGVHGGVTSKKVIGSRRSRGEKPLTPESMAWRDSHKFELTRASVMARTPGVILFGRCRKVGIPDHVYSGVERESIGVNHPTPARVNCTPEQRPPFKILKTSHTHLRQVLLLHADSWLC